MFAKINHVAIVSEKYALITKFYEAAFGMYQSKTSPKSALTVGDGYVGLNINPRKAGRPAGLVLMLHGGQANIGAVEEERPRIGRTIVGENIFVGKPHSIRSPPAG